ncbi:MAG: hypothetical protein P8Z77_08590 [Candidatus Thiodiazotropha sp.]
MKANINLSRDVKRIQIFIPVQLSPAPPDSGLLPDACYISELKYSSTSRSTG